MRNLTFVYASLISCSNSEKIVNIGVYLVIYRSCRKIKTGVPLFGPLCI